MEKGSDAMKALHNGKDNGLTLIPFSVTTLYLP